MEAHGRNVVNRQCIYSSTTLKGRAVSEENAGWGVNMVVVVEVPPVVRHKNDVNRIFKRGEQLAQSCV